MFLGNTDIEKSFRIFIAELGQSRAEGHCGGDERNTPVLFRHFTHQLAELVAERVARRVWLARIYIKVRNAVEVARIFFGIVVALALDRVDMEQDGRMETLCRLQSLAHRADIVTVDRSHIAESHFFKYRAFINQVFNCRLELKKTLSHGVTDKRYPVKETLQSRFHTHIFFL